MPQHEPATTPPADGDLPAVTEMGVNSLVPTACPRLVDLAPRRPVQFCRSAAGDALRGSFTRKHGITQYRFKWAQSVQDLWRMSRSSSVSTESCSRLPCRPRHFHCLHVANITGITVWNAGPTRR